MQPTPKKPGRKNSPSFHSGIAQPVPAIDRHPKRSISALQRALCTKNPAKRGATTGNDQPPGFSRKGWGLARKFSGRILYEKFPTGLCLDNIESVIDKTGQLDTKYLFSGKSFVRNVQEKRSRKSRKFCPTARTSWSIGLKHCKFIKSLRPLSETILQNHPILQCRSGLPLEPVTGN